MVMTVIKIVMIITMVITMAILIINNINDGNIHFCNSNV